MHNSIRKVIDGDITMGLNDLLLSEVFYFGNLIFRH